MMKRLVMKVIVDLVFVLTVVAVHASGLTPLDIPAMSVAGRAGVAIGMIAVMLLMNRNIDRKYTEDGKPRAEGGA